MVIYPKPPQPTCEEQIRILKLQLVACQSELKRVNGFPKTTTIGYVYEDQLPKLSKKIYNAMFPLSVVDGVRLFPCVYFNGMRAFLVYVPPQDGGDHV